MLSIFASGTLSFDKIDDRCANDNRYGNTLVQICATFKNAETEIKERVVRVEACWLRIGMQLDFVRRIAQILDEHHQLIHCETLRVISSKLEIVVTKLESVVGKKTIGGSSQQEEWQFKRVKYVVVKESIDKAIEDLKTWQDVFDPTWYLIMKAATPQVDLELARVTNNFSRVSLSSVESLRTALKSNRPTGSPIFLPEDGLERIRELEIPFSSATLGQRSDSVKTVVLERITCPPHTDIAILTRDIRDLARKLSHSNPAIFGLLNCKGVVKHLPDESQSPPTFTFVFRIPNEFREPRSLRSCLLEQNLHHSLSDRFKLACDLAKAISYVHTFGFVHKNVRPETILIFKTAESTIGSVSLVGFENFRTAEGRTLHSGDTSWEKNLYRHPRRQGLKPGDVYVFQHDIYSLGVCLLELGLWDSFVTYDESRTIVSPSIVLGLPTDLLETGDISVTKDHLVSLARVLLPRCMGNKYAEIVETCLTCLDENNTDFGDEHEFADSDGIQVGVRYVEKVTLIE